MSGNSELLYQHTQIGYVTGGVMAVTLPAVYFAHTAEYGKLGTSGVVILGLLGTLGVLFSTLTVKVTRDALIFYFGPGFWTKRFPLEDIISVEAVRNSPLYGWGIRWTFHGWLYNVSGLQAVELEIQGEGQIRIGTDEPERLKQALETAMMPA